MPDTHPMCHSTPDNLAEVLFVERLQGVKRNLIQLIIQIAVACTRHDDEIFVRVLVVTLVLREAGEGILAEIA